MRSSVLHFAITLAWVATADQATAQPKRKVTPADYGTFGTLSQPRLSPDGKWATYHLGYDSGADTLFLQNTTTSKRYAYPSAGNSRFSTDGEWFAAITPTEGLSTRRLATGNVTSIPGAVNYQWYLPANRLVVSRVWEGKSDVLVVNIQTGQQTVIPDATEFSISSKGDIALLNDREIRVVRPGPDIKPLTIIKDTPCRYKKLLWDTNGTSLAFLEELPPDNCTPANHRIWCYNLDSAQWRMLDPSALGANQRIISPMGKPPLAFAPQNGGILFYRANARIDNPGDGDVEVWDSMAPLEFPEWQANKDASQLPKLSQWFPQKQEVQEIGTNERPSALLLPGLKYALTYNKLANQPQIELEAPADLYLTNLEAAQSKLLLSRQDISPGHVSASPKGNYMAYLRGNDWWVYDVANDRHTNLTSGLGVKVINSDSGTGQPDPCGSPGWASDESAFIVYDKFDVWLLSVNGGKAQRITAGHGTGTRYRITDSAYCVNPDFNPVWLNSTQFDLTAGMILEARGARMEGGYFFWNPNENIRRLDYGNYALSGLQKATKAPVFLYICQSSVISPRLMVSRKAKAPKMLFRSNPQHKNLEWPTAELISYKVEGQGNLKGILYYPAKFDPEKQYPMVVYIYERLSQELHQFLNPDWHNSIGFNPVNYGLDGYLVLLPDISYTIGKPGESALNCVAAAVNAIAAKGFLQREKVGLIGHSFGGYEVSYIITQTPMFAAAVAGAGVTDLVSNYLAMHGETEHSNMWRYESQQFRMGASAYDNFAGYIANSPITHAGNITTPLLSWTGNSDNNVPATQSMELHLALRMLQKKNILLVYPNEGHTVLNPANQLDLNKRIKQWFDSFLKRH